MFTRLLGTFSTTGACQCLFGLIQNFAAFILSLLLIGEDVSNKMVSVQLSNLPATGTSLCLHSFVPKSEGQGEEKPAVLHGNAGVFCGEYGNAGVNQ